MALLYAHRGPISGLTHFHLQRESVAERAARMADAPPVSTPDPSRTEVYGPLPGGRLGAAGHPATSRVEEPPDTL
jgi:hypothetical protein